MTVKNKLPGAMDQDKFIEESLRVNLAGELGAINIYAGQMAVLKNDSAIDILKHMHEQEKEHFDYFAKQISKRNIRPSLLYPLWKAAGFALGAGTALISKETAMACTVAVEEVIDQHYQDQLDILDELEIENELQEKIKKFQAEELEHRDIGIENNAEKSVAYTLVTNAIKIGSKLAIEIAKKI